MKEGPLSYQQVASRAIDEMQHEDMEDAEDEKDQKNIRRRVYDALNVLVAVKVLRKNEYKQVMYNPDDPSQIGLAVKETR